MSRMRLRSAGLITVLIAAGAAGARAGDEGRAGKTYASVVPSGVHMYLGGRSTPSQDRVLEPIVKAFVDLGKSGIGEDVLDLVTMDMPSGQATWTRDLAKRIVKTIGTPDWGTLLEKEVGFAFRLQMPLPEYLYLFRVDPATADAHRGRFRSMFESIVAFEPEVLSVTDETRHGAAICRLVIRGVPISFLAASRGDTVALSTSDALLDDVIRRMDSPGAPGCLAQDERFTKGLEGLGPAENTEFYFDLAGYIGFIRGIVGMASAGMAHDEDASAALSVASVIVDEFMRMGTITATDHARGDRLISTSKLTFTGGDSPGFFEQLAIDQKPIDDFWRLVPADASSFFMSAGVRPATIHDALVGLIQERVPRSKRAFRRLARMQEEIGFNVREDLLSWLDGGFGWIVLPGRPAGSASDLVFFLRTTEGERPAEMLQKLLVLVRRFLASKGLTPRAEEIPGMESLRELSIAEFPWVKPVVGAPPGALVIASSRSAVERVGAAMRGNAANFRETPAYRALGYPDGPLGEVFYHDVRDSLECLAAITGGVGVAAKLLPENHDTRHARKIGSILVKLSAFLRQVDVAMEVGGWGRYDAASHSVHWRTTTRMNPERLSRPAVREY